jgi:hypothetical protein
VPPLLFLFHRCRVDAAIERARRSSAADTIRVKIEGVLVRKFSDLNACEIDRLFLKPASPVNSQVVSGCFERM